MIGTLQGRGGWRTALDNVYGCFAWMLSTVSPGDVPYLYKHLWTCDKLCHLPYASTFLLVPRIESVISSVSHTPCAAGICHRLSTRSDREYASEL